MSTTQSPILVVGATGNVGRNVVTQLLDLGVSVRALTRDPDRAGLPPEVDVVRGDLTASDEHDRYLEGVDATFLVLRVDSAERISAFVDAAAKKARRLVLLSSLAVRDDLERQADPIGQVHADVEQLVTESGLEWTFLRPGAFATNTRWWASQIRSGDVVRWPYADAALAPIHERAIAAVGVRALTEVGHAGKKYVLTGPEAMTHADQVRIIGEAVGRPLRFEEIPPDAARDRLAAFLPPPIVDTLLRAWANMTTEPALVTSTVHEVTGAPAVTFREWAIEHAGEFRKE